MSPDMALQRAASIMAHHMFRGIPDEECIAKAQAREPHLSDEEIRDAYEWALAAVRAAQVCNDMMADTGSDIGDTIPPDHPAANQTMGSILDKCRVPWRYNTSE